MSIRRALALLVTSLLLWNVRAVRADDEVAAAVRQVVTTAVHPWLRRADFTAFQSAVRAVYDEGDAYHPVWLDDGRPTAQATAVIGRLAAAGVRGLAPAEYDAERLAWEAERLETTPPATPTEAGYFDVGLTVAAMRYASDAHLGRVDPQQVGFGLDVPKALELTRVLRSLAEDEDPGRILDALDPPFPLFGRLVLALARVRALAGRPDLPAVPDLPKLEEGDAHPGLADVRRLLVAVGDLAEEAASPADPARFDAALAEGVRRFQDRHGRTPDGVIGKATLKDLRVPMQQRVEQIELAMERLRWLPEQFADRFVIVNVPEFRLRGFEAGSETASVSMSVVVGSVARKTETPILHADMRYVIFKPIWTVPYEIARDEILPKAAEDPTYLEKQRMEVVDGQVRQLPGPGNSLGLVKFVLPNPYQVYLHDTPSKELFRRSRRDFSHGCIRVADPVALAEFVLGDGWDRERIVEAMKNGPEKQRVNLPEPVPVYLLYTTTVVDPEGRIYFFDDIYGHDARLARALAKRYQGTAL